MKPVRSGKWELVVVGNEEDPKYRIKHRQFAVKCHVIRRTGARLPVSS